MGLFDRVVDRLRSVASDDDTVLAHICEEPAAPGVLTIAATRDRERVTVQGRVTALTLPTSTAVTALVVDVSDGSGVLELVFVGRKAIPGIDCGVLLRASGRVSQKGSRRVMFNPSYEIVPTRER